MQFRKDIQGFRALAFLLVFIFHINSAWLPGGFLGVDLFFVISGYLMTSIIIASIQNNKFNYIDFLIRRIKRIVPAYFFFLIITILAVLYFFSYSDILSFRKVARSTAFFASNISFSKGSNYFGAQLNENPLLHTWSLAIEMQFYFILPLLLYVFRKKVLLVLVSLTIFCTLYSSYHIFALDQKQAMYFSLIARFPEFLVGGIFSFIFKRNINISRNSNNIIALICLLVLLLSCIFITEETAFPGALALVPCIAIAILLSIENNLITDVFSNKILVYIGELSYSLYLWHFPILAFMRYRNDSYNLMPLQIVFAIILTFLLAWLSYTFIENRFRTVKKQRFFVLFAPGYILLGIMILLLPRFAKGKYTPDIYSRPIFGIKSHRTLNVEKLGVPQRKDSIVLIGDSHALMLKPFLHEIGLKNNFSFYTLTSDSFPAIEGIKRTEIPKDRVELYNKSLELIDKTKEIINKNKFIILSITGSPRPKSEYTAIENLAKNLRSDQRLILVNSFPIINKTPLRFNKGYVKNTSQRFEILKDKEVSNNLSKISKVYPQVYIYNLNKGKIREDPGFYNDTIAYYDKNHINTYTAKKMAIELNDDFMKFFNTINTKDQK